MKVITGTVENGKIELPTKALMEGTRVAILAPDSDEPVALSAAEELELEAAVNDLNEDRFVEGFKLLGQL